MNVVLTLRYIIKRLITGSCKPMLFFFYLSSVDINKIPIITNLGTTSLTRTFDENAGVGTPVYDVDFTDANTGETHTFSATFSPTPCEDMYTIDSNSKCYTVTHYFLPRGTSWSYGRWIYNYACNQCMSSLKLWVPIPPMPRSIWYNIM
jgi:hypothetical protein